MSKHQMVIGYKGTKEKPYTFYSRPLQWVE
jgi:hypothetical protein